MPLSPFSVGCVYLNDMLLKRLFMLYVDVDAAETAAVSVCTGLSYLTLCSIYLWRTHTLSTHTTHAIAHGIHHLHQRHTVYV